MTQKEGNKIIQIMWLTVLALYVGYFVGMVTYTPPTLPVERMCVAHTIRSCPAIK